MIYKVVVIISTFYLLNCSGNNKAKKELIKQDTTESDDNKLIGYSKDYNAINFDTLNNLYTYQINSLLKTNNRFIITEYFVQDIIKNDSNYTAILLIFGSSSVNIIKLNCSEDEIFALTKSNDRQEWINKFVIFEINEIKKAGINFSQSSNDDIPQTTYNELTRRSFIGTGILLDIIQK